MDILDIPVHIGFLSVIGCLCGLRDVKVCVNKGRGMVLVVPIKKASDYFLHVKAIEVLVVVILHQSME